MRAFAAQSVLLWRKPPGAPGHLLCLARQRSGGVTAPVFFAAPLPERLEHSPENRLIRAVEAAPSRRVLRQKIS